MKTYTTPGAVGVEPEFNVVQQLLKRVESSPDHPALAYRDGDAFVDVSTSELWVIVRELAAGLVAAGVQKGDRVALHSGTRIEFTYFDYAIWAAGAATTTIYETSSAEQVRWILSDSGSVVLITEDSDTLPCMRRSQTTFRNVAPCSSWTRAPWKNYVPWQLTRPEPKWTGESRTSSTTISRLSCTHLVRRACRRGVP